MDSWKNPSINHLLTEASIWSADLTHLKDEIRRVDQFVDLYHFDVSDNHFVPGLLFFPDLVAALRPLTHKPFHVHLMVDNPLNLIEEFARAGANLLTVHAGDDLSAGVCLHKIQSLGLNIGLALGLDDPLEKSFPYLDKIDLILLMGTPLGVKGQTLSTFACPRIRKLRDMLRENSFGSKIKLEADGGIRTETVPDLRAAGADVIVMGSLLFKSSDLSGTFAWLHGLPAPEE